MNEKLSDYLRSNPIITRHNLSDQEIDDLSGYIRKIFPSSQVEEVIRIVEEVIGISPTLGWKEILETVARKVVEFLSAEAATIRIFDPETGRLVAFGSYQYADITRLKDIPVEKSVAGKAIKSSKSYIVPDILSEPDYQNKDIVKNYGFNSLMAVPIQIPRFLENKPDIQGAIQIYYKEKNRTFDPLEVTSAELLARRASYVLAKKRILELQRLNLLKEKIVEKIFVKLSHREGIKMKDVFGLIIPELEEIMQIQGCSLFMVALDRKHVHSELEYPAGQEAHDIHCMFVIQEHPYIDALVNDMEKHGDFEHERIETSYILIKDPAQSRLSNEELKRYASKNNVNSVLLIPLKARDEINYFLVFYAKEKRQEFTDQEIELLSFFGKEIMKALRIEKLDDILHDFKNPSIAIAGFAKRAKRLLEKEDIANVRNKITEYLDIVLNEAIRMQEITIYPNIEGRERVIDLTEVLMNRFRINEEAMKEQKRTNIALVQEELEKGLYIYSYPFALERVLDNLLDNATKAVPSEGGKLSVKSYRLDEMACFEIRNTGKIPEKSMDQIRKGEVKGRGLNIIYRFVETMRGKLEVYTEADSTTVRVFLPLHRG